MAVRLTQDKNNITIATIEFPVEVPLQFEDGLDFTMTPETSIRIGDVIQSYTQLTNKPMINGVILDGNKTNEELHIPTRTSELINDSNFISSDNLQFYCGTATEVV